MRFPGPPFLRHKRDHKNSVLPIPHSVSNNKLHPTIPKPGVTVLAVVHHASLGKRELSGTSDCAQSKARGTPCEKTL